MCSGPIHPAFSKGGRGGERILVHFRHQNLDSPTTISAYIMTTKCDQPFSRVVVYVATQIYIHKHERMRHKHASTIQQTMKSQLHCRQHGKYASMTLMLVSTTNLATKHAKHCPFILNHYQTVKKPYDKLQTTSLMLKVITHESNPPKPMTLSYTSLYIPFVSNQEYKKAIHTNLYKEQPHIFIISHFHPFQKKGE